MAIVKSDLSKIKLTIYRPESNFPQTFNVDSYSIDNGFITLYVKGEKTVHLNTNYIHSFETS